MPMPIHADPVPLRMDENGAIRVGDSRITLDLIVREYERGMSAEAIVQAYDVLELADVHAAIAYYLRHRDDVSAYLRRRDEEAARLRARIESEQPLKCSFKEGLRARRVSGTARPA